MRRGGTLLHAEQRCIQRGEEGEGGGLGHAGEEVEKGGAPNVQVPHGNHANRMQICPQRLIFCVERGEQLLSIYFLEPCWMQS